jgi:hypothetical protein
MSYQFEGTSYSTVEGALVAVATAWIYGGRERPYPETLATAPAALVAECVESWGLADLLAEWGADAADLADAMASVLAAARAEAAHGMILCRSDAGDGGWSLYPPGTSDEEIASGDVLPLLTGKAELDEDGAWNAPTAADYEQAAALLAARRAHGR